IVGPGVAVRHRDVQGPIDLACCLGAIDLLGPVRYGIVAQSRATRSRVRVGDARRSGGLGAIAGGLEGGTARPTSTVIHPSRLLVKKCRKSAPQCRKNTLAWHRPSPVRVHAT